MTNIKAELILASKNAATNDILYTFRLTYPRSILSEMNTHRAFSRNTASSRAIPIAKMLRAVVNDPFTPISIGTNQNGMQAGEELRGWRRECAEEIIYWFRYFAVAQVWLLNKLGVHKQVANRYLEPYSWTTQVVSTTDISNFLKLRYHGNAEPHIRELARQILHIVVGAKKIFFQQAAGRLDKHQILQPGEWHLPFITFNEKRSLSVTDQKQVSTARAARVSYTLLDTDKPADIVRDRLLCAKLFGSDPKHLSPTEHPAQAMPESRYFGNFRGFQQYRKEIPGESGEVKVLNGTFFTSSEISILSKLVRGFVVGPTGRAVLDKLHSHVQGDN